MSDTVVGLRGLSEKLSGESLWSREFPTVIVEREASPTKHWAKFIKQQLANSATPEAKEIQFILDQLEDIDSRHWGHAFIMYAASSASMISPRDWLKPHRLTDVRRVLDEILSDAKIKEQEEKDRPVGEKSEKIRLDGEYRHPLRTPIAQIVVGDKVSSKL